MAVSSFGIQDDIQNQSQELLDFPDNKLLIDLCGVCDKNLAEIEQKISVQIIRRGNQLVIVGEEEANKEAAAILMELYERLGKGREIEPADLDRAVRVFERVKGVNSTSQNQPEIFDARDLEIKTRKKSVEPRTEAQKAYVRSLLTHELSFGIGPAGTGKTYLAVAMAVSKFMIGEVDRIVFSRPAVEAGEKLGYLPGDMKEKVDPYMQPLYDALNDFLPSKQLARYIEEKRIEIAPLAFMRGRTLSHAYVVLDEAQNATSMQMKMFLTRLGEGSRMAITGDVSQIDLPRGVTSGLSEAQRLLSDIPDIGFSYFTAKDVVRHRLVAAIIEAYDGDTSIGLR
ncbi:PhoH family protein [Paracoccaceae bacterium]|nr:PhoH family protein [Paracoccaceae bacterium]